MNKRVQCYPSEELFTKLSEDSNKLSISISALVIEILERHYNLIPVNTLPFSQTVAKVYEDVEEYISTKEVGDTFELSYASKTLRNIPMVDELENKPSTIRGRIGKEFSFQVRNKNGRFNKTVGITRKSNGGARKGRDNGGTIYYIKDGHEVY